MIGGGIGTHAVGGALSGDMGIIAVPFLANETTFYAPTITVDLAFPFLANTNTVYSPTRRHRIGSNQLVTTTRTQAQTITL